MSDQPSSRYDHRTRKWVTQVFPSLEPSGRRDVTLLGQWLRVKEKVLSDHLDAQTQAFQAGVASHDNHAAAALEITKQAQFLYSAAFNELVRQVSTQCAERGRLLAR